MLVLKTGEKMEEVGNDDLRWNAFLMYWQTLHPGVVLLVSLTPIDKK